MLIGPELLLGLLLPIRDVQSTC